MYKLNGNFQLLQTSDFGVINGNQKRYVFLPSQVRIGSNEQVFFSAEEHKLVFLDEKIPHVCPFSLSHLNAMWFEPIYPLVR